MVWIPMEIKEIKGKNLPAFQTDASHNKQIVTTMQTKIGRIIVKQMTGFFVRRIRNYLREGQEVKTQERLGSILLGSRVELWLPAISAGLRLKRERLLKQEKQSPVK
jgi:phosphatidylserine decarboxylase